MVRCFKYIRHLQGRQQLTLAVFLTLTLLALIWELNSISWSNSKKKPFAGHKRKIILSWTSFFHFSSFMVPDLKLLGCAVQDCVVTSDRALLDISDALVIHWFEANLQDLPSKKETDQRWILMTFEPPMHAPKGVLEGLSSRIDWTATYRLDSDIPATYGRVDLRSTGNQSQHHFPPLANSEELSHRLPVAWMNSHCKTYGRREQLAARLSRFIKVDIYGRCNGNLSLRELSIPDGFSFLAKRYVFYLSFENSVCKDYVTEKLFFPLSFGLIPVVYGGADYDHQLPPGSFINALSFDSARDLASHLDNVRTNWTLYSTYFSWRKNYFVPLRECNNMFFCGICEKLHNDSQMRDQSRNLTAWWSESEDCAHPKSGLLSRSGKYLKSKIRKWYEKRVLN